MVKVGKDKDFSKIYHLIIDNEMLAQMSNTDIRVYLTLNRFAGYETGIAFPSVKTIIKLSGVDKNAVHDTVERLEAMGLILTYQGGKEKSFSKYYGIVRREFIDIELALRATAKPERSTKAAARGKDGRFIPTPKNAEQGSPENADREIPENTDTAVPQTGDIITVDAEKNKRHQVEIMNRDRGIEGNPPRDEVAKPEPRVNIREYALEHGFFKAMDMMMSGTEGSKKMQSAEEFEKVMEERTRRAKEYFGK